MSRSQSPHRSLVLRHCIVAACLLSLVVVLPAAGAKNKPQKQQPSLAPGEVMIVWCGGTADVYLNGKELREAGADFTSRSDESGTEYSAKSALKPGDVITVGCRRGSDGSGFRLAAFDHKNRLVWQTETTNWHAFHLRDPRMAKRWFLPASAAKSATSLATVPSKVFRMTQFEKPKTDIADAIWDANAESVYLYCKVTERRNYVRLPLLEMAKVGGVMWFANGNQLDGLQPDDLDASNRVKSYKGPLHFTLEFSKPTAVHGALVSFAGRGSFRWQIETAESRKEMAAKNGDYRVVAGPKTSQPEQAVDLYWKPATATVWQLTATKEGDSSAKVELHKFYLLVPAD